MSHPSSVFFTTLHTSLSQHKIPSLSIYPKVTFAFLVADSIHSAQTFFFNELILHVLITGIISLLFVLQARCLSSRDELLVNWDCALFSLSIFKA